MTDTKINEAVARKLGLIFCEHATLEKGQIIAAHGYSRPDSPHFHIPLPDYCHSIAAAWEIVEKEHQEGYFRMHDDYEYTENGKKLVYRCIFGVHNSTGFVEATADTAPMAICLAFLKLS